MVKVECFAIFQINVCSKYFSVGGWLITGQINVVRLNDVFADLDSVEIKHPQTTPKVKQFLVYFVCCSLHPISAFWTHLSPRCPSTSWPSRSAAGRSSFLSLPSPGSSWPAHYTGGDHRLSASPSVCSSPATEETQHTDTVNKHTLIDKTERRLNWCRALKSFFYCYISWSVSSMHVTNMLILV